MSTTISPPALLSAEQAAEYLGVAVQTLSKWRCTGEQSIPYIRVGRSIRYRVEALEEWLHARTVAPTD